MVGQPSQILEVLSEKAMALCSAGSAGISLLQGEDDGEPRFFWPAISGAWAKFTEGGLPRNASPCGKVVDEDATLIFLDPIDNFPVLEGVEPPIKEVLLAPFHSDGRPIGTVWVLAHEGDPKFDRETRRRLESLAEFVSSAYRAAKGESDLAAKKAAQIETAERSRVMNAETDRLEALLSLRLLDTPPEPQFDAIVQLASRICNTPVALVSLVDHDRQWFKAKVGFDACETPIGQSVCSIAMRAEQILVIPDLTLDPRTQNNTLVTEGPQIRFYAGAALRSPEGQPLGALCVIDDKPRPGGLTSEQADSLILLAGTVMTLIELRRAVGLRDTVLVDQHRSATTVTERLREAEARLRVAQSAARIGAFETDIPGRHLFATGEFVRIFGLAPAESYGVADLIGLVLPEDRQIASSIGSLDEGSGDLNVEYRIRRPSDGAIRWIHRRAAFEHDHAGHPSRLIGVVEDVTERKLTDARAAALMQLGDQLRDAETKADAVAACARLLGETLGATRTGYAVTDVATRHFTIEGTWSTSDEDELIGLYPFDLFAQTVERLTRDEAVVVANVPAAGWLEADHEAYRAMGVSAFIILPMMGRGALEGILFVHDRMARTWSPEEIDFASAVADRAHAAVARLQAEADQRVLNLELGHRMKNTMAVVQSIAQQTLRRSADPDALNEFDRRLSAMGKAHEVLLRQSWVSARITAVVDSAIDVHGWADAIDIEGPELNLSPKTALNLALLLHELLTNAVKYGALSNMSGRISIRWQVVGAGASALFRLTWTETGGPPVVEPTHRGFGSRLIRAGLGGTSRPEITYASTGLIAEFSAPLSSVLDH